MNPLSFLQARIEHVYRSSRAENPIRQYLEAAFASDIPSLADILAHIPAAHIQPFCNAIQVSQPLFDRIVCNTLTDGDVHHCHSVLEATREQLSEQLIALCRTDIHQHQADIEQRLRSPYIEVNLPSRHHNGNSALHYAIKERCIPVIQCLLEHGAEIDVMNEDWESPLHLVLRGKHAAPEVFRLVGDYTTQHLEYPTLPESRIVLAYFRNEPNILGRITTAINELIESDPEDRETPVSTLSHCATLFNLAGQSAITDFLNRYADKVESILNKRNQGPFYTILQVFKQSYADAVRVSNQQHTQLPRVNLLRLLDSQCIPQSIQDYHQIPIGCSIVRHLDQVEEALKCIISEIPWMPECVTYLPAILKCFCEAQKSDEGRALPVELTAHWIWMVNCMHYIAINEKQDLTVLTNIIDILREGSRECPNKALALFKDAENAILRYHFRDEAWALFSLILMQGRRIFVDQFLGMNRCLQTTTGQGLPGIEIEVGLMNQVRYNVFLSLGMSHNTILYVDDLIEAGALSEANFAKPGPLFESFFKLMNPEELIDQITTFQYPMNLDQALRCFNEAINTLNGSVQSPDTIEAAYQACVHCTQPYRSITDTEVQIKLKTIHDNLEVLRGSYSQNPPINDDTTDNLYMITPGLFKDVLTRFSIFTSQQREASRRSLIQETMMGIGILTNQALTDELPSQIQRQVQGPIYPDPQTIPPALRPN